MILGLDAHQLRGHPAVRAWTATALVVLLLSVQSGLAQRPPAPSGPLDRARAAILHGQYAEAESLLTPLASRTSPNDATLELGLLLRQLGRRAEADRWLEAVVSSTRASGVPDLVRVGRAAHALGQVRIANEAFQDAAEKAPKDAALNIAWGELFLQAHNRAEAAKSFQTAIESDEKSAAARYGLAAALAEDSPPPRSRRRSRRSSSTRRTFLRTCSSRGCISIAANVMRPGNRLTLRSR